MSAFSPPSRSRDADWPPAPTFISRNSVNSVDSGMILPPPTDSISSDMMFTSPSRNSNGPQADALPSSDAAGPLITSTIPPLPAVRTSSKRSAPDPPASTLATSWEHEEVTHGSMHSMHESPQLSPGGIRSRIPELPSLSKAIPASFSHMLRANQQSTGDSAGGTERPRNVVQPASLGRADDAAGVGAARVDPAMKDRVQEGGGVGAMKPDFLEGEDLVSLKKSWTPMDDSSYLGTTSSVAESPVVIHDGFGTKVSMDRMHEQAFPIQLDSTGSFKWESRSVPQTTQISWLEANWIVASHPAESQQISFLFYMRSPWLPQGLRNLGSEVVPLISDGPIIIQDTNGNEVPVRRGQDRVLTVGLDKHCCFAWHCNSYEQRIHAPSKEVTWVHVEYPEEGQDVRWTFYGNAAKRKPSKGTSNLTPGFMDSLANVGLPGMVSRGKANLPELHDAEDAVQYFTSNFWCCRSFPLCNIYCPGTFACLVITIILLLVGVLWPGMEIDTSFDTFLEADSHANQVRAAFMDALSARGPARRLNGSSLPSPRRLGVSVGDPSIGYEYLDPSILHKICKLEIMYRAKDGGNIIDHLDSILEIELLLRSLPRWKKICLEFGNPVLSKLCEPGGSLVNIMWAVRMDSNAANAEYAEYNFSGYGREPLPLEATLFVADLFNMNPAFFPKTYTGDGYSSELRSLFEFDLVVSHLLDPMSVRKEKLREIDVEYKAFVKEDLYPALMEQADEFSEEIEIFWKGTVIGGHEVWVTLMADSSLAIGSFAFILLYLTFHTRSPLLGFVSLLLALISIPTAFVTSAILSGGNRVTGASFLSLFLLVGLGADVVLVFVNFWALSKEIHEESDYPERILFTYKTAGLACLATSATTAASFFANLASVLKPLREFGFFMGLCIMLAYTFILVGLPPVLIVNEKLIRFVKDKAEFGFFGVTENLPLNSPVHSESSGRVSAGGTVRIRHTETIFSKFLLVYIDGFLIPYQKAVLASFVLMPIIFLIWTGAVVEVDGGMPEMFPKDHNQNAGKQVASLFETVAEMWVRPTAHVCNLGRKTPSRGMNAGMEQCALNWCQIGVGSAAGMSIFGEAKRNGHSVCTCMPTDEPENTDRCRSVSKDPVSLAVLPLTVPAEVRFVGPAYIPKAFWDSQEWKAHILKALQAQTGQLFEGASVHADARSTYNLTTLVQEHWESGNIVVSSFMLGAYTDITIPAEELQDRLESQMCGPSEICYCGTPTCKFRDEPIIGDSSGHGRAIELTIPGERRLDGLSRRLNDSHHAVDTGASSKHLMRPVPAHFFGGPEFGRRLAEGLLDVAMVWGIEVTGGSKLLGDLDKKDVWTFSSDFRPDGPAAQRHLYKACKMSDPELRIVSTNCWITEFRNFLIARGQLFPARAMQFNSLLQQFVGTGLLPSGNAISDFMWFDETSQLRATYVEFYCSVNKAKMPSAQALKYMKGWNQNVEEYNEDAPDDAGQAWHTSSLWIRAEAEKAIVDSTLATLLISIGCGFLGAVVFTHVNIILSLFVVCSVGGVTSCLAFFMTGVMGWAIGAVEVLGLIVFVGYSITYSLHIAHKYEEHMKKTEGKFDISQRREFAASHALKQMTSSVLGSALTTLGSSFFLFFCTMGIFVKLATVLFAVTVFAEVFALCGLPAALLVVGPRALMCFGFLGEPEREWRGGEESSEFQSHGGIEETHHEEEPHSPKSTAQSEKSEVFRSNPQYSPAASPVPSAASAMHAAPRVTFGETSIQRLHMSPAEGVFMPSRPRFNTGTSTASGGSDDTSHAQPMDPRLTTKTHAPFGSPAPVRESPFRGAATAPAGVRRAE